MHSKLLLAASAGLTVLALTGCAAAGSPEISGEAEASTGTTLAEVQSAGEIVVATEGTYRPFSYHEGGSGDLTGYDVEVIEAVAAKLGVDVTFQETQWDAIFAGLESGRFDVIANQVSINPERLEAYDFSDPYTISPGVLLVGDATPTSARSTTLRTHERAVAHEQLVQDRGGCGSDRRGRRGLGPGRRTGAPGSGRRHGQ